MIRLAIAGTGGDARLALLAAAHTDGVQLVGVAAPALGDAEELASLAQVRPLSFAGIGERADAVIVAHDDAAEASQVATDAALAGLPVLIWPPLAPRLADVDRLIAAAESTGAPACFGAHLLFAPVVDAAVRHRAALGDLEHLSVILHAAATDEDDPETTGRRALRLLVPHALSLLCATLGDLEIRGLRCRLDTGAHLEVRLSSGLIAVVDAAFRDETTMCAVQIASSTGTVRAELAPQLGLEIDGRPEPVPTTLVDGIEPALADLGYLATVRGFVGAIARRGGRVCPVGFGRMLLELAAAAAVSADDGAAEVELPISGIRDRIIG